MAELEHRFVLSPFLTRVIVEPAPTGALNVAVIVGRCASTIGGVLESGAGLLVMPVAANAAAPAVPVKDEATVAIAARAAVITDRRINAEAIWGTPFKWFVFKEVRPTTQRECAQGVTAPAIAPARPRVKAFAA